MVYCYRQVDITSPGRDALVCVDCVQSRVYESDMKSSQLWKDIFESNV